MVEKGKSVRIFAWVCAFFTALALSYLSSWVLAFFWGFIFTPPGSAHDIVLERIWRGEKQSSLKKIKFSRIEITQEKILQAFDKALSIRSNFYELDDARKHPRTIHIEDHVTFEFTDGTRWTSYFVTWEPDGLYCIVRSLLPSYTRDWFEYGHDETFLPFPVEIQNYMQLALQFMNAYRFSKGYPKLVIGNHGYSVFYEKGFYLQKKNFTSSDELLKSFQGEAIK